MARAGLIWMENSPGDFAGAAAFMRDTAQRLAAANAKGRGNAQAMERVRNPFSADMQSYRGMDKRLGRPGMETTGFGEDRRGQIRR